MQQQQEEPAQQRPEQEAEGRAPVYACGSAAYGQAGEGNGAVAGVAAGDRHTAVLTGSGELLTLGDNESGQLGRPTPSAGADEVPDSESAPERGLPAAAAAAAPGLVVALDSLSIAHVSCGQSHTVCVTGTGDGDNSQGQLGIGEQGAAQGRPRLLRPLRDKHVCMVACGSAHTLALSYEGQCFSWGDASQGQLGRALPSPEACATPAPVEGLADVPVAALCTGYNHCFALTASSLVYCWGANKHGQLGLGFSSDCCPRATINKYLRGKRIADMACGAYHTLALSATGTLYSFGDGTRKQLGCDAALLEQPRLVDGFEGMSLVSIACGRAHSVAVRRKEGGATVAYTWGSNFSGQLGHGDTLPRATPTPIRSGLLPPSLSSAACGAEHTLFLCRSGSGSGSPGASEGAVGRSYLRTTSAERVALLAGQGDREALALEVDGVLSTPACANGSFLSASMAHLTGPSHSGLDLDAALAFYTALLALGDPRLAEVLQVAILKGARALQERPPALFETQRAVLVLLRSPTMLQLHEPRNLAAAESVFSAVANSKDPELRAAMTAWLAEVGKEHFVHYLEVCQRCLSAQIKRDAATAGTPIVLMSMLYEANEQRGHVPYTAFYNREASDNLDVGSEHKAYLALQDHAVSFLLNPVAKSNLFQYDAFLRQQSLSHGSALIFLVRREFLIDDTLTAILQVQQPLLFKRPVKVVFEGEQAIDEGGVRKEFFQLCIRKIMDLDYGLFEYLKESDSYWFNKNSFESSLQYKLIGILMGMAIFNRITLDVRFSRLVYALLLGERPSLSHVKHTWPQLLDYDGDNIEEVFALTFSVEEDRWGERVVVDLKPNGREISVTAANRQEFVELYVRYLCCDSVREHVGAFAEGFKMVADTPFLHMFRPEELENLICGEPSDDIDIEALRKATVYEGAYHAEHPTIKMFWEVLGGFTPEQKRKFLFFTTASDRIPVGGLQAMRLIVQRAGPDTDHLPTAMTCFNCLLLPDYSSKEKMANRLVTAIHNCEGFGLR
eukprot:m51a1_g9882 hypothetical protein (1016) ;mRNA; f:13847-18173